MLVLRISVDGTTQEIRTRKPELVLGSDPTADVTIAGAGWAGSALRLRVSGPLLIAERLDGDHGTRTLRVGDTLPLGGASVEVLGLIPPEIEAMSEEVVEETSTPEVVESLSSPEPASPEPASPEPASPKPAPPRTARAESQPAVPGGAGRPTASTFELADLDTPTASPDTRTEDTPARQQSTPTGGGRRGRARPRLKASPFAMGGAGEAQAAPETATPPSTAARSNAATSKAATSKAVPPPPHTQPSPTHPSPPPPGARSARGRRAGRAATPEARRARAAQVAAAVAAIREQERMSGKPPHEYLGPREDFGAALLKQLRQAPYFVIATAAHLLLFLILAQIEVLEGDEAGVDEGTRFAAVVQPVEEVSDLSQERTEDELEGDEIIQPEFDLPEPSLEDEAPTTDDAAPEEPDVDPFTTEETIETPPATIGISPSVLSSKVPTSRPRTFIDKKLLEKDIHSGTEGQTTQQSAAFLDGSMGKGRGSLGDIRRRLSRRDVLVVDGNFDTIAEVLKALRIPFTTCSPYALVRQEDPVQLRDYKIVFWNCGDAMPPRHIGHADLRVGWKRGPLAREVRAFVNEGGYLFTTDWAIAHVVVPAFTEYVGTRGARAALPEINVAIEAAAESRGHPLLRGVFPRPGARSKWWLEKSSYDVIIHKKRDVQVLVTSRDLEKSYDRDPAVAVTFEHGKGRVLHCMGHYYQKGGNLGGTIAVHRIALNFVTERLDAASKR